MFPRTIHDPVRLRRMTALNMAQTTLTPRARPRRWLYILQAVVVTVGVCLAVAVMAVGLRA